MNLDKRIRILEAKVEYKKPGCNPTLFIVVADEIESACPLIVTFSGRQREKLENI